MRVRSYISVNPVKPGSGQPGLPHLNDIRSHFAIVWPIGWPPTLEQQFSHLDRSEAIQDRPYLGRHGSHFRHSGINRHLYASSKDCSRSLEINGRDCRMLPRGNSAFSPGPNSPDDTFLFHFARRIEANPTVRKLCMPLLGCGLFMKGARRSHFHHQLICF